MHPLAVMNTLHRGNMLVASVPATDDARLAWVGIYPLDLQQPPTQQFLRVRGFAAMPNAGPAYHVRRFEVERRLIEQDVCISETEMTNKQSYIVWGDEDLLRVLAELGVRVDELEPPFKSDYPI